MAKAVAAGCARNADQSDEQKVVSRRKRDAVDGNGRHARI